MNTPAATLSPRALDELQEHYLRVKAASSAERLWERVLTLQDRNRLGGDLPTAYHDGGTVGMWMKLRGVSANRALVEVAKRLNFLDEATNEWLLRELGEMSEDPDEFIARVIDRGDLVLMERPRGACWAGQKIEVNWERMSALWNFFFELCQHAKAGQPLDSFALGSHGHPASVTKLKSRLLSQVGFPATLGRLIRPAGHGTQRLELPADKIHIFEILSLETLRERNG